MTDIVLVTPGVPDELCRVRSLARRLVVPRYPRFATGSDFRNLDYQWRPTHCDVYRLTMGEQPPEGPRVIFYRWECQQDD